MGIGSGSMLGQGVFTGQQQPQQPQGSLGAGGPQIPWQLIFQRLRGTQQQGGGGMDMGSLLPMIFGAMRGGSPGGITGAPNLSLFNNSQGGYGRYMGGGR